MIKGTTSLYAFELHYYRFATMRTDKCLSYFLLKCGNFLASITSWAHHQGLGIIPFPVYPSSSNIWFTTFRTNPRIVGNYKSVPFCFKLFYISFIFFNICHLKNKIWRFSFSFYLKTKTFLSYHPLIITFLPLVIIMKNFDLYY